MNEELQDSGQKKKIKIKFQGKQELKARSG